VNAPMALPSDSELQTKEHDLLHPGTHLVRYDRNDPRITAIDIPEGDMTRPALFIHTYRWRGNHHRSCGWQATPHLPQNDASSRADTRPNLRNDQ